MQAFDENVERRRQEVLLREVNTETARKARVPQELVLVTQAIDKAIVIATERYVHTGDAICYIYFGQYDIPGSTVILPSDFMNRVRSPEINRHLAELSNSRPGWRFLLGCGGDVDYFYILVSR